MGLLDWFGKKDAPEEPWRKFARANVVEVVNTDTGDMIEIRPDNDDPNDAEGLLIGFDYVDAQGECTSRAVLCHQVFRNGDFIYVRGLCTTRESMRTFRTDRMERVVELRSGKVVPEHEAFFFGLSYYNEDAFDRRPRRAATDEEDDYRLRLRRESAARHATLPGLRILAYLGLSDGERSADERRVEEAYVRQRLAEAGLGDDAGLAEVCMFMAEGLAPTRRSYVTAIGKIANETEHLALVARCAMEVVRADGAIGPTEREALNVLLATARKKRTAP